MSWLLSFKGLSLGKGRKNKRNNRELQDSQGRKRLRPSSSCYNSGSYDLAAVEERPNRFSWAASPFEEEYMNNDVGKTDMCSVCTCTLFDNKLVSKQSTNVHT